MNSWSSVENILCIRLDSLGDVLMTTPALRAVKASPANPKITLLTSPAGAEVGRLVPDVDDVLIYEAPWMKATPPRTGAAGDRHMIEILRRRRFDAAIVFTVYSQSALPAAHLAYLSDVPFRLAHCRENPYQLLTHWVKETEPERGVRHEVQRHLDLVAEAGFFSRDARLSLSFSEEARRRVRRRLREHGAGPDRPLVAIHPGASAPSRRYDPLGFAAAAKEITDKSGATLVLTGSAGEAPLIESIRRAIGAPSIGLAGELNVEELAALIGEASVLLVNNTGPAHIAAAVGTPVVDLYALTNPQHTPWQVPSRVLFRDVPCKYCYKSVCPEGHNDCLRLVTPSEVAAAVIDLLGHKAPRSGGADRWLSPWPGRVPRLVPSDRPVPAKDR